MAEENEISPEEAAYNEAVEEFYGNKDTERQENQGD
jgi:hypothetical protein